MDLINKIFVNRLKSENGFVLIAAIMAVMIMLAVGFFILTTSTQDIRISARLVGEGRAMSAAECGAQATYASSVDLPYLAANPIASTQCDANDPSLTYTATTHELTFSASSAGYDVTALTARAFLTTVTGTDNTYGASATITIGMKSQGGGKAGTVQGPIGGGGG